MNGRPLSANSHPRAAGLLTTTSRRSSMANLGGSKWPFAEGLLLSPGAWKQTLGVLCPGLLVHRNCRMEHSASAREWRSHSSCLLFRKALSLIFAVSDRSRRRYALDAPGIVTGRLLRDGKRRERP